VFVRTASARDLPAIRALLVATWHDTYDGIYGAERVTAITDEWHSLPALAARLERPGSEFLVADDGARVGGVAFAAMGDDGASVSLQQLYVLPELQGRGIGGLLLDEIEGCFPEATRIEAEVEEKNARAIAFYRAQGFAERARRSVSGAGGAAIDVLVLERPIVWAD
jgi:ribosomal protein S18 acetylase RimI-like enzyme